MSARSHGGTDDGSIDRFLAVVLITAALTSCVTAATPSPTPVGSASTIPQASISAGVPAGSPSATSQVVLAGTLTRVDDEPQHHGAFADRGALYAIWTRDGPSPYLSRVERFEPTTQTWQRVFEDDASFYASAPDAGRVPLLEYRESGGGASDTTFVVLDLATGRTTKIDAVALSPATFHGGGGGPRGPASGFVIAGDRLAWARVNELAGGTTEGELRVASLADPSRFTVVGRSRQTIVPLWLDAQQLVYLLGGSDQDEIRVRDLVTGTERAVARVVAPAQDRGPGGFGHSGSLLGWIENLPTGSTARGATMRSAFHAIDLVTGATVDVDLSTSTCGGLTGNALGFAWGCSPDGSIAKTLAYYDPRAQRSVEVVRSAGVPSDLRAVDGGFVWFDFVSGVRRVNLLIVR